MTSRRTLSLPPWEELPEHVRRESSRAVAREHGVGHETWRSDKQARVAYEGLRSAIDQRGRTSDSETVMDGSPAGQQCSESRLINGHRMWCWYRYEPGHKWGDEPHEHWFRTLDDHLNHITVTWTTPSGPSAPVQPLEADEPCPDCGGRGRLRPVPTSVITWKCPTCGTPEQPLSTSEDDQ